MFGKCNWANGHGHNYKLEITLYGEVDRQTGMVMNLTELKSIVQRHVLDVLDHRNLDLDVPYFESRVSSVENIAIFVGVVPSQKHSPSSLVVPTVTEFLFRCSFKKFV